jgi:hypothetical protein
MPTLTIGYAPDNQLVVNDPNASPYHAIIRVETQRISIMDAGSVNGTYVNEQRLEPNNPRFLSTNDTIRIGNTTFRYEERVAPSSASLFPDNRGSNPGLPPDPQGRPGGYTDYGQQQGNLYPPFPGYAPPPPSYNANPYDPTLAPGQMTGGHTPFPPTNQLPLEGLQGQPHTPPPVQKKNNLWKILLIAAVALIVFIAVGGGVFAYVVTRPQPVISVNSQYAVDMTPAGSTTTEFRISGHDFSNNSSITFLLDGAPTPGNPVAQSDNAGKVAATLIVTKDWSVGEHKLTARDASGYTTKETVALKIVPQGQAHTPGPNGAPPDDTSFTITATYGQFSGQIELQVSGHPDPAGGKVCSAYDDGSTHTSHGDDNIGTYTDTYTFTCTGTYKAGKLSYAETLSNDKYTYTNGVVCTERAPFVYVRLEGTFNNATNITGNYSGDAGSYDCTQGATLSYNADHGNWSGQVK